MMPLGRQSVVGCMRPRTAYSDNEIKS